MKNIVIYKSLSGFTKRYAQWIAEDLHTTAIELGKFKSHMIEKDTIIIFGGSLHAIGINGYKKLNKILKDREYNELVLFAVGASPYKDGIENEIKKSNCIETDENKIRLFYLRGGFNYAQLDPWNKFLMILLKLKIMNKKPEIRTPDEKGMLASYQNPIDATKKENTREIVNYARGIEFPPQRHRGHRDITESIS
ncbi:MAG: hypothetical protein A2015_09515 [Spirochaetes bacterium GWF1_31_7]|nr:MAG: hypothetical protein A2Y30_01205 [Spirochaetes bacterium GWE1_32_154]OHD45090.1 MAG: hypothetical protein A2Y29_15250 [Spirochaetes bacterium GWE2_31_10]OHD52657.1 MAG: hypothetical protein A2015_09515 [Spirochaetes bacterium GWF1_31_7]OHD75865.1 MAG: hypothetical protein A2355_04120 [Spirochaetes bacterium RIFOXYB1_FULL_32_8]HBD95235.1 flavodoxin [Spirochaetia bacterium]